MVVINLMLACCWASSPDYPALWPSVRLSAEWGSHRFRWEDSWTGWAWRKASPVEYVPVGPGVVYSLTCICRGHTAEQTAEHKYCDAATGQ